MYIDAACTVWMDDCTYYNTNYWSPGFLKNNLWLGEFGALFSHIINRWYIYDTFSFILGVKSSYSLNKYWILMNGLAYKFLPYDLFKKKNVSFRLLANHDSITLSLFFSLSLLISGHCTLCDWIPSTLHRILIKASLTISQCVLVQWITGNVSETLKCQLMMWSDDNIHTVYE